MLKWIISLLLEVGDQKLTPGMECLDAFNPRLAQSFIYPHNVKKFTDILKSGVMGWSNE